MFTDDAYIDYSSAGAAAGPRDEVADWFEANFAAIPWSMHYITNIESDIDGDTREVRAMFYNPMQLPGMTELSYCGGYYHHDSCARPTAGAAGIFARRTCGSPTRRRPLRKSICDFARVPSDNSRSCRTVRCHGSTMETRHQLQGIELRYALTMYLLQHGAYYGRRAHQGAGVAGLHDRRACVETGVGCAALGAATRQGPSTCAGTLRPRSMYRAPRSTESIAG